MNSAANIGKARHQLSKTTSTGVLMFSVTIENGELSYAVGEFFPSRRGAYAETVAYTEIKTVEAAREEWRKRLADGYTFHETFKFTH